MTTHASSLPVVLLTATTEVIRGRWRVRVNEAYTDALAGTGLVPVILPPLSPDLAIGALDGVAGVVLTGGEDIDPRHYGAAAHANAGDPHSGRDEYELALACAARERQIPTLAICRGAQLVNVAFGGTLVQDIGSERAGSLEHDVSAARHDRVHTVHIEPRSVLARAVGTSLISTNSSHHQSVDRIAAGLTDSARADDGIIEALESTDSAWWMLAVQWHPEELIDTPEDWDRRLFRAFADAVRVSSGGATAPRRVPGASGAPGC